jgi:cytochrome b561
MSLFKLLRLIHVARAFVILFLSILPTRWRCLDTRRALGNTLCRQHVHIGVLVMDLVRLRMIPLMGRRQLNQSHRRWDRVPNLFKNKAENAQNKRSKKSFSKKKAADSVF